jgi:hypothetical protein
MYKPGHRRFIGIVKRFIRELYLAGWIDEVALGAPFRIFLDIAERGITEGLFGTLIMMVVYLGLLIQCLRRRF